MASVMATGVWYRRGTGCNDTGLVWSQSTWLGIKVACNLGEVCYSGDQQIHLQIKMKLKVSWPKGISESISDTFWFHKQF